MSHVRGASFISSGARAVCDAASHTLELQAWKRVYKTKEQRVEYLKNIPAAELGSIFKARHCVAAGNARKERVSDADRSFCPAACRSRSV